VANRRSRGRNISGILLLDKPVGVSSNGALQRVKRIFNARKAGHTGSLDPLASGMLPICLGEATKISGFLLEADKYYRVTIKLGVKTATGDTEGDVVGSWPVVDIAEQDLQRAFTEFSGKIDQLPPMYSAIKKNGQALYKLARQGIEVERDTRQITIHSIELLHHEGDELELDVHCSKGTYIRTLADDLGVALGCGGGHVTALRRLKVGPFADATKMVTLEQLQALGEQGMAELDALLMPIESAVAQWPDVCLSRDSVHYVRKGQAVFVPKAPTHGWVKLYSGQESFLGVGHVLDDGRIAPKRLFNV